MKEYNILILDDLKLVGENIYKRICKVNVSYSLHSGIKIIPHFTTIDITNIQVASERIAETIDTKKIDYLLLDRGLSYVIDSNIKHLDSNFLYAENRKGVYIEQILKLIPKQNYTKIKGIIIYTYNEEFEYVEPEALKNDYIEILPKKFNGENVQIFMSNSELYKLAGLKLYNCKVQSDYLQLGLKTDFKLYGLFMGEILYHKVVSMINQREKTKLVAKKSRMLRNIFILFFVFTGLSIGGNALYNMLANNTNNYLLIVISIVFSLFMPLFILLIKPELIISIDNEDI
jgi:hypothetical protein